MPIPRIVARLNRVGLNRVTVRVAPWAPGFGVVLHHGRKTGREFRTPVNVFAVEGGFVVALTYGAESDWVRNVRAEGGCRLITHNREHALKAPRLVHDPTREHVTAPARHVLRLLKVEDFLELSG
jgi:deazaflavin-dependent oxidoreductase (nitroreductase family)